MGQGKAILGPTNSLSQGILLLLLKISLSRNVGARATERGGRYRTGQHSLEMLWSPQKKPWPDRRPSILPPFLGWLTLAKFFNLAGLFPHLQNEDQVS